MSEELSLDDQLKDAMAELQQQEEGDTQLNEGEEGREGHEEQGAQTPEQDPLVEKAKSSGWTDKESWVAAGKDPDQWVDKDEFIRRQPLFEKINKLTKAIKERDKRIDQVSQYAARAAENERNRVLAEIEAKRKEAFESQDYEAFSKADEELAKARQDQPAEVTEPDIPEPIREFAERNARWFEKDQDMTEFAVERTGAYRKRGMDIDEALRKAEADVRKFFPEKFENPNKQKPAAVVAPNRESRPRAHGYNDLNAEQRAVFATLKNHMTLDEYVKGLKEQGELK